MPKVNINGRMVNVEAEADTPLLWVIRDELGMTGTKFGCGMAQCGACTVWLNGQPVRSCVTPIAAVGSGKVTTIEGVDKDQKAGAAARAVQAAWEKHDVVQCGYCQSGQIMSASALLAKNAKPSDADIDAAMSGNICRCATYHRIRAAIHDASAILAGKSPAKQEA